MDDGDGETVFPMLQRRTADALADRLEARVALLRSDEVPTEEVLLEIRRQIATCALDEPIVAADLAELMVELVHAREHAQRAV